jgi:2-C-methyl-D-erythritol 2,4-cyclodiphosphate synthase
LRRASVLVAEEGYRIAGVDSTIILEKPRIGPFVDAIRALLAEDMRIEMGIVSVKCKTNEGVGAVGRGEAVEASAVCVLTRLSGPRRVGSNKAD